MAVGAFEDLFEALDTAAIEFAEARVKENAEVDLVRRVGLRGERCALGVDCGHPLLHGRLIKAVFDRLEDRVCPAVEIGALAGMILVCLATAVVFGPCRFLEPRDEGLDEFRGKEAFLEADEDAVLDLLAGDRDGIVAGAHALAGRAPETVGGDDGIGAAADPAPKQARQQKPCPLRAIQRIDGAVDFSGPVLGRHGGADRLLAPLRLLPEIVLDDAKVRHRDALPCLLRIGTGDAAARRWALHIGTAVPDKFPVIEGVVEDAGAAVRLAPDGGVRPGSAARTGDALAVEVPGDRLGCLAVGVFLEDAPDDGRFGGNDLPPPAVVLAGPEAAIAISEACGNATLEDAAELAAAGLLRQILEPELGHHAHDGDMDRGDLSEGGRVEPDAVEDELVLQVGGVGKAAAEAVDRLADHDVEPVEGGVGEELLETRTEPAGAADGGVPVVADEGPALGLGIAAADLDLVLDRGLALQIGGIAGVDDGAHGGRSLAVMIGAAAHDGLRGAGSSRRSAITSA